MTVDKDKLPDTEKVKSELREIARKYNLDQNEMGYLEAADKWLDHTGKGDDREK